MTKPRDNSLASRKKIRRSTRADNEFASGNAGIGVIGVDEAGLGPNLGPLVVAATTFRTRKELIDGNWWEWLESTGDIARKHNLVVDDSKAVLARADGRKKLAATVLSALSAVSAEDGRLDSLCNRLDPNSLRDLMEEHWYCVSTDCEEKFADGSDAEKWKRSLRTIGIRLESVQGGLLFPSEFNARLDAGANKADIEAAVIVGLIRESLTRFLHLGQQKSLAQAGTPESAVPEQIAIFVDRLGGRKNYRTIVEDIAWPDYPQTVEESRFRSVYGWNKNGATDIAIRFEVKADGNYFPVALASMVAKYLRERCMEQFNAFWARQLPGLDPTAGYPTDAKRFLAEVKSHLPGISVTMDQFWRKR